MACGTCSRNKTGNRPPAGHLRPPPVPQRTCSFIAVISITGLPESNGTTCILTVVERFSKAAHFAPPPKLPSAKEAADLLINHVFRIRGLPVHFMVYQCTLIRGLPVHIASWCTSAHCFMVYQCTLLLTGGPSLQQMFVSSHGATRSFSSGFLPADQWPDRAHEPAVSA